MKDILAILTLTICATLPAVAQFHGKADAPNSKIAAELTDLERQLSDALVREDTKVLDRLWSKDLVFTFPNGTISNKAKRLAAQKPSAQPSQSSNLNDKVQVFVYGNTAVVTVLSTWKGKAGAVEYSDQYQATHVWSKQQGRWQLVAAHVSDVKK